MPISLPYHGAHICGFAICGLEGKTISTTRLRFPRFLNANNPTISALSPPLPQFVKDQVCSNHMFSREAGMFNLLAPFAKSFDRIRGYGAPNIGLSLPTLLKVHQTYHANSPGQFQSHEYDP